MVALKREFLTTTDTVPGHFEKKVVAHEGEEVFRSVCQPNCFQYCPHTVTVRDGRVVQTSVCPLPDPRYDRICLRGMSNLQRLYSPTRIRYPMKRVGERGEGKWQRISWDEAITMITDNWKENIAKYGPKSVSLFAGSGRLTCYHGGPHGAMTRLGNILGLTKIALRVDYGITAGMTEAIGWHGPWPGNGPEDMLNADTVIILGMNPTESQINYHHWFLDAKDAGAKLIVVDPVFTHAAAQADQYIPIRPGADPAFLLSLAYCILRDETYDAEFMRTKTVCPYLVKDADGTFLRMKDITDDAEDERPVVIAESGEVGTVDDIATPRLFGTAEVEGIACTLAGQKVYDKVMEYDPKVTQELTGIAPEVIEELAHRMMQGPTTLRCGWGGQAYNNGHMVGKAMMVLAGITSYIGKKGADMGAASVSYAGFNHTYKWPTGTTMTQIPSPVLTEVLRTGEFKGEPYPLKSMYIFQGNHIGGHVDQREMLRDMVGNIDFLVTADIEMTDTAAYSDLVLPAAHFYEVDEFVQASATHPYVQWSEKAIEPLFEAKGDAHIARLLSRPMGVSEYFDKPDEEHFREMLDSDDCRARGITLEKIKEKGAIRVFPEPWLDYRGTQTFNTPDHRMHIYKESPTPAMDFGQEVPVERERVANFFPPEEAWPGTTAQKKYPLVLLSERPRYRVHSQWAYVPWLRELDPEPIIKVNSQDAADRGLENRDLVELYNDRGHAVARLIIDNSLMPGVIKYPKGWQRDQHIAGSFSELSSMRVDPMGVNQNFFDATCEMRKWEESCD